MHPGRVLKITAVIVPAIILLVALIIFSATDWVKSLFAPKTDYATKRVRILPWPGDSTSGLRINVPKSPPELGQLFDSCLRLIWIKNYDRAAEEAKRVLYLTKARCGENSPEYAESLRLLAYISLKVELADPSAKAPLNSQDGSPHFARATALMEKQFNIEKQCYAKKPAPLFVANTDMADYYMEVLHDQSKAVAILGDALKIGQSDKVPRQDALLVAGQLASIHQRHGSFQQALDTYTTAAQLATRGTPTQDQLCELITMERGLLSFQLDKPKEALDLLFPLIQSPHAIANSPNYKYVLYCALISSEMIHDKVMQQQIASSMVDYSARIYGKNSPQWQYAMVQKKAMSSKDGDAPSTADINTTYKQALLELSVSRHADELDQQLAATQGQGHAAQKPSSSSSASGSAVKAEQTPPRKPQAPPIPYGQ